MMAEKESDNEMKNLDTNQLTVSRNSKGTQTDPSGEEPNDEIERQKKTIRNLEDEKERVVAKLLSEKSHLTTENDSLNRQLKRMKEKNKAMEVKAKLTNETNLRNEPRTLGPFQPSTSSQRPSMFSGLGTGAEGGAVKSGNQTQERDIQERFEEISRSTEEASVTDMSTNLDETYVPLLFKIAELFQLGDLRDLNKFKTWAGKEFSADNFMNMHKLLLYLDKKKVIRPSDLSKLREFCIYEISRFDIVYLIDCFTKAHYSLLSPEHVDVCQGLRSVTRAGTSHAASFSGDMMNALFDKCCICHGDVSTGYQISLCSHKVHKECVIRNEITRCPICGKTLIPTEEDHASGPPRKHYGPN